MTDQPLNTLPGNFQDGETTIIKIFHKIDDVIQSDIFSLCSVKLLLSHTLQNEYGFPIIHIFQSPMVFSIELIDDYGNLSGITVSSMCSSFINEDGEIIINGWYDANMTLFKMTTTKGYIACDIDGNYYLTE
jgi:hypothetical protein